MKFSTIKVLYNVADNFDIDARELVENINNEELDFEINDHRFIRADEIDSIQVEELSSDNYMLGCFTASFIADNSNLSLGIIKALQDAEQYEALGQHLIDNDCVGNMQQEYSRLDGYGYHFAHYDHNTHEVNLNGQDYYIFRIN